MRRRTALTTLAAALAAVTGCGRRGEAPTDAPRSSSPPEATGAPTTPQLTDERTPAPTATPADTSASATDVSVQVATEPTHDLGERFVVEGDQPVAYTVHRLSRADRLGPIGREPDRGAFLVVECTVENIASPPMVVPIEDIALRGGVRLFARQDDTDAAAADGRVDLPPLTDETIFRGTPLRGVLVFDLPTTAGNDYYLRITPPGDAETPVHRVPVGPIERLPELS